MIQTPQEVSDNVDKMEKEANNIRYDSLRMVWAMRGGVSYSEVMNMSHTEREGIGRIIKENIETTNKTKMPYY